MDMKYHDLWRELQQAEYECYKKTPVGTFSTECCKPAIKFGDVIRDEMSGLCLDIGCGLLPLPSYMKNQEHIKFVGIDPYKDKIKRKFDFCVGLGEWLPFKNETFDGIILATTIDHMIDPMKVIDESRQNLKSKGVICIWFSTRPRVHLGKSRYNKYHQWAFTSDYLINILHIKKFRNIKLYAFGKKQRILFGQKT
jgi:SAM-dependent methyltransferase